MTFPVLVFGGVNPLVALQRRPAVVGAQLAAIAPAVRAEVLEDATGLEDVAVGLKLGSGVSSGLILVVFFQHSVVVILDHEPSHFAFVDGDIDPFGVRGRQAKLAVQRVTCHGHVVFVHEKQVALAVKLVVARQPNLPRVAAGIAAVEATVPATVNISHFAVIHQDAVYGVVPGAARLDVFGWSVAAARVGSRVFGKLADAIS